MAKKCLQYTFLAANVFKITPIKEWKSYFISLTNQLFLMISYKYNNILIKIIEYQFLTRWMYVCLLKFLFGFKVCKSQLHFDLFYCYTTLVR